MPEKFFNILGVLIASMYIFWHLMDTSFSWFHDSTIGVQATIAKNWLLHGKRILLNGEVWTTHPPLPVILAMPGEILNRPILHRLIPLVFSMGTLIFWYKFIKLHYDNQKLAFIATWVAGICPIYIYFAPVLNYEQPLFFFITFGLFCYENYIKNRKFTWLIGILFSFLCAGFTEWQAGILVLGFIVDWKRSRWSSLMPLLFTGTAIICSACLVENFIEIFEKVGNRFMVSFLSPSFWFIQAGRAFSLFTPITCIAGGYFWYNRSVINKNLLLFTQLISGIILFLVLSQWFLVHNFSLYYFWLPISFGSAYILFKSSKQVRWVLQSMMIVFTCISLYFLSTHRETFIKPLVTFCNEYILPIKNNLVLNLGSRQYVFAYKIWEEYSQFEKDQNDLNKDAILITAPLLTAPINRMSNNIFLENKRELYVDFSTIYVDTTFVLPKSTNLINLQNKKFGYINDLRGGAWILFKGKWENSQFVEINFFNNDEKFSHLFIPGNKLDWEELKKDRSNYHWIPEKITNITSIREISYFPRFLIFHDFIKSQSTMMGISSFSLIKRIQSEFGIPILKIFYKKSEEITTL